MDSFHFEIERKPIPKPRMTRADAWKDPPRRAVSVYREFVDATRAAIIDAKREAGLPDDWTLKGNVAVTITFTPKHTQVRVYQQPGKQRGKRAGDIDNLCKSVLEALQEFQQVPILIDDDSQVTMLYAEVISEV